jgi:hypothetical protein
MFMNELEAGQSIAVITRASGRSSIPETVVIEPIGRGVLDAPLKRGVTV